MSDTNKCSMCSIEYCDKYNHDESLRLLAVSLSNMTISSAEVVEHNGSACVVLKLVDGRVFEIGVTGSLHDEAYLIFDEVSKQ